MENFSSDDWGAVDSFAGSYVRETNKAVEVLGCPACGKRAMKYFYDPEWGDDEEDQHRWRCQACGFGTNIGTLNFMLEMKARRN